MATIGTLVGIATSAVSAGPEVYRLGKLELCLMATYPETCAAARDAVNDLRLQMISDAPESGAENGWELRVRDDTKAEVAITIERRTPALCWCRIDVGMFGSESTARILMERIEFHILAKRPQTTTAPEQIVAATPASAERRELLLE